MPNNFRVIGDIYVSKVGNDVNAGTDPNLPKKTLQNAADTATAGQVIVVGSGDYTEGIDTNTQINLRNDGIVVLRSNGVDNFRINGTSSTVTADQVGNFIVTGFNGTTVCRFNNSVTVNGITFEDCEIGSGNTISYNANECSFVNCFNNAVIAHRLSANSCAIINSTLGSGTTSDKFTNCYVDTASTILTTTGLSAVIFSNNDIEGVVDVSGVAYNLYFDSDGTAVSPTPANPDIVAVYPDIYTTRQSFNEPPSYFNIAKRDYYTVIASSAMLRAGTSQTNIGGSVYGSGYNTNSTAFYPGVSSSNVTLSGGDIVVTAALGQIVTGALEHANTSTEGRIIQRILPSTLLNFDTDFAAGGGQNNNVLNVTDYLTGTAGANPKRLTIEMRWTTIQNPDPLVDGDWNNDTVNTGITAGAWTVFEIGGLASIDANAEGRGSDVFIQGSAAQIRGTFYQYRISLRDGINI